MSSLLCVDTLGSFQRYKRLSVGCLNTSWINSIQLTSLVCHDVGIQLLWHYRVWYSHCCHGAGWWGWDSDVWPSDHIDVMDIQVFKGQWICVKVMPKYARLCHKCVITRVTPIVRARKVDEIGSNYVAMYNRLPRQWGTLLLSFLMFSSCLHLTTSWHFILYTMITPSTLRCFIQPFALY